MAERRTFTVEIYEDTGKVKEVRPPSGVKAVTRRLPKDPIEIPRIASIVVPIEIIRGNPGMMCVHARDCRTWCW